MKLIRYYDDGYRVGLLVKETNAKVYALTIGASIVDRIVFPADDDDAFEYLDYPDNKARTQFLRVARERGITVRAAILLGDAKLLAAARAAAPDINELLDAEAV